MKSINQPMDTYGIYQAKGFTLSTPWTSATPIPTCWVSPSFHEGHILPILHDHRWSQGPAPGIPQRLRIVGCTVGGMAVGQLLLQRLAVHLATCKTKRQSRYLGGWKWLIVSVLGHKWLRIVNSGWKWWVVLGGEKLMMLQKCSKWIRMAHWTGGSQSSMNAQLKMIHSGS